MKGFLGSVLCLVLSGASPLFAQSAPNRAAAVCAITGAHPEVFQGAVEQSDARRLAFLPTIISALNHIDGGNWGELLKETGKIPADIIVWRPTLEHFDVMTDSGCYWENKNVIAASWRWLAVVDSEPVLPVPTPTPTGPPSSPPPISVDVSGLSALITARADALAARLDALEQSDRSDQQQLLQKLDAVATKVDDPGWLTKFVSNRYVQMVFTGVTTWLATRQLLK